MKKILLFSILSFILLNSIGQKFRTQADSALIKELVNLSHKSIEAFDLGDTSLWSRYVDDEYFVVNSNAEIEDKSQAMKDFRPPYSGYKNSFYFEDVHVVRDSNLAIMSYHIIEPEDWEGHKDTVRSMRKTDIFIWKGGRWLLLASHESRYPIKYNPVLLNPKIYDSYVGKYQLIHSLVYLVTKENNKLMIQEMGQDDKIELLPLSTTTFYSEGDARQTMFVKNKTGQTKYLIFRRYGLELKAKKIE